MNVIVPVGGYQLGIIVGAGGAVGVGGGGILRLPHGPVRSPLKNARRSPVNECPNRKPKVRPGLVQHSFIVPRNLVAIIVGQIVGSVVAQE